MSVRAQILNLLTDLKKDLGLSMMFISHDIQTVRYISDKIVVMNHGQIMEEGPAKQVFRTRKTPTQRCCSVQRPRCSTRTSGNKRLSVAARTGLVRAAYLRGHARSMPFASQV